MEPQAVVFLGDGGWESGALLRVASAAAGKGIPVSGSQPCLPEGGRLGAGPWQGQRLIFEGVLSGRCTRSTSSPTTGRTALAAGWTAWPR